MTQHTGGRTAVIVIGGGYAGVLAANRLTRREDVAVTLVNPRATFVERLRLHQLVAGSHDAVVDYTTRRALDRLRALRRSKETYVGPWLPEPLLTSPDVAEHAELAESLSMAVMLVLETLSPTERAVFVLREVFDVGYDEIAEAVGKTPAAVRQIAHRSRRHVDARRPREVVSPRQARAALTSFQHAVETGGLQGVLDVLAPDVVLISDGGGVRSAALRPVTGIEKVVRLLLVGLGDKEGALTGEPTTVNGDPALLLRVDGEIDSVMTIRVEGGLVTGIYFVRNPAKLTHIAAATPFTPN